MKILLTTLNSKYVHSNLALKYLYTVTATDFKGIELREFTINNDLSAVTREIMRGGYDLVCFSTYIWNVEQIKTIGSDLKLACPSIKILMGGPEVSFGAVSFMNENPWADFVLKGEGENSFYEFCKVVLDGEGTLDMVPGLVFRAGDRIYGNPDGEPVDFNAVPFPYSILDCEPDRVVYYESTRGCPFNCSYCISSLDKSVRAREIEKVKSEIAYFIKKNVAQVKFVDRTFNYNRGRAYELIKFIIDNDNGRTAFHLELCADLLDSETIELFGKARRGLFELECGVQSTNPQTLRAINRNENIFPLLANVEKLIAPRNVHMHVDLIAGLPYESYDAFAKSFNRVYALKANAFQLGFLKVLKGTETERTAREHGVICQEHAPYEVISTAYMTADEIAKLKTVEDMVDIYYNRGGFTKSIPYLIKKYTAKLKPTSMTEESDGNAFLFYEALADFYYKNGYQNRDRKKDDQYRILMQFMKTLELSLLTEAEAAAKIELDAKAYMDELNYKRFLNKGWEI